MELHKVEVDEAEAGPLPAEEAGPLAGDAEVLAREPSAPDGGRGDAAAGAAAAAGLGPGIAPTSRFSFEVSVGATPSPCVSFPPWNPTGSVSITPALEDVDSVAERPASGVRWFENWVSKAVGSSASMASAPPVVSAPGTSSSRIDSRELPQPARIACASAARPDDGPVGGEAVPLPSWTIAPGCSRDSLRSASAASVRVISRSCHGGSNTTAGADGIPSPDPTRSGGLSGPSFMPRVPAVDSNASGSSGSISIGASCMLPPFGPADRLGLTSPGTARASLWNPVTDPDRSSWEPAAVAPAEVEDASELGDVWPVGAEHPDRERLDLGERDRPEPCALEPKIDASYP